MRRVIVGRIAGAHGILGEVRVQLLADAPLLLGLQRLALSSSDAADPQAREIESEGGTTARPGELRLRLSGVAWTRGDVVRVHSLRRGAAEALRGMLLLANVADLPTLPTGSHYWFELVGCVVETANVAGAEDAVGDQIVGDRGGAILGDVVAGPAGHGIGFAAQPLLVGARA